VTSVFEPWGHGGHREHPFGLGPKSRVLSSFASMTELGRLNRTSETMTGLAHE
jgi:hypothetical protein